MDKSYCACGYTPLRPVGLTESAGTAQGIDEALTQQEPGVCLRRILRVL